MPQNIIQNTVAFVKEKLEGAEAGHDWFHIERVWKLSKKIAAVETCNLEVVELSALLHDIADPKFHEGDETLALKISQEFLEGQNVSGEVIDQILFIIKNISFKNRGEIPDVLPIELQIVQDADRIDAIGAIGIARTFNYGGFKNNLMYHPEIQPKLNMTKEEYKKSTGTTINHFYEKLLLLKDLMNTDTGKKLAEERHDFMLNFLDQFSREWNVE
ncbi:MULTISPECIES: HD domain-containing protein [unclassified Kaistella]|uniref:HD domain-containing protein n=1 Tax=unclassified Kaistella TaxID=2762626 RepID=UPI0027368471|nr:MULTISPECIES: HD domain-containing protein [unclassified Kaistella]MCZ2085028.1 HD domain-containing protein [Flavobacteriales bacterium]MDP2453689.1 HD domain-containing protein [Kaistella sp. SH11-4b]MDP2456746.1 HD domain-containing protein [Kaistella sp. SH40-3]MDP2459502.1 HD domain-containing protein [Kaistella sp. SH19-2b]